MTAYIEWTEEATEFDSWYYAGSGIAEPIYKIKRIKKSARWSDDVSDESIAKAKGYIKTDMQDRPDAKVVIR